MTGSHNIATKLSKGPYSNVWSMWWFQVSSDCLQDEIILGMMTLVISLSGESESVTTENLMMCDHTVSAHTHTKKHQITWLYLV